MSVTTTADERLSEAKEAIENATKALSEVVVDRVWGAEDFSDSYRQKMRAALAALLDVRDLLG